MKKRIALKIELLTTPHAGITVAREYSIIPNWPYIVRAHGVIIGWARRLPHPTSVYPKKGRI